MPVTDSGPCRSLIPADAGQTVPITDRYTGERREAQVFIGVLECSNSTFAEATWSQQLPDWLGSHVRMLAYFDGVPAPIVPDNLKSAITRALRYEPELNPSYQDFAEHYEVAILSARVRKPGDKAKVEAGVLVVERWILARLRNRTFFSSPRTREHRLAPSGSDTRLGWLPSPYREHYLQRFQFWQARIGVDDI